MFKHCSINTKGIEKALEKNKEAHEKNIEEIDEALIALGYKGGEVE